jgi:hypothetical protein
MSFYYYHYTTKAGFEAIAGGCGASKKTGQSYQDRTEGSTWSIKENQPQKGALFADQHASGFYLTELSPGDLDAKPKQLGKLGLGKLHGGDMFMFIFKAKDKKADFVGANNQGVSIHREYASTHKYYIKAKKIDEGSGLIYLAADDCDWCGPVPA